MSKRFSCAVCTFLLVIFCGLLSSCENHVPDIYIFEDIIECENIEVYKSEGAVLTEYDTPENDKNLKDLKYESFYSAYYESEDLSFEIFAYEFDDSYSAKLYYNNATGKNTVSDIDFTTSTGVTKHTVQVIDGQRTYTAVSSKEDAEELHLFLGEIFSKELIIE